MWSVKVCPKTSFDEGGRVLGDLVCSTLTMVDWASERVTYQQQPDLTHIDVRKVDDFAGHGIPIWLSVTSFGDRRESRHGGPRQRMP